MIRFIILTISIAFIPFLIQAQQLYELDEKYDFKSNGLITLNTNDADIIITGSQREDVNLKVYRKVERVGTGSDEEFEMNVEERNGNLFIREIRKSGSNYWIGYKSIEYKITIEVPSASRLVVSEDDGDLEISNITGDLDIKCEDGDLILNSVNAEKINIMMEDGDVRINNSSGFLSLKSEDGDVETNKCRFSRIDLNTEDGDVNIESSIEKGSVYKMESEDGDIKFYISGSGATIKLNCDDGYIQSSGDFEVINKSEGFQELVFGDKSATISIKTEDGDIKVSR